MIQANGQAAQRFLGPPRTADYKPSLVAPLPLWSGHDTTWYSWFDVEWMRRDPQCQFGLRILRAPLATVTWEIPASAPEVAAWVDRTLRKVWTRYLNKVTAYLEYGSCGGEVTWRYDRASDLIELDELLDLHVLDMKPLQQRRKQVGVRVKSSLGDMQPADLFAPRYWWIANEPEFGACHGRARLAGAWIPWQEKTARHGARDVRRTWYVKNVMDGGTLYVPPGTTEVDIGVNKANVDYGRELMEKSLAGGVKVFPNVTDEKGKRLWEYEAPKINGELTGIHTLMEELDIEIIVGMGVPPEVVQAADTGSGWSGRSVPFLVFLTSEDQLADTTVQAIDRHILRPGVAVNFGEDARYEIRLKSLVKQAEEEEAKKQGQAPGAKPDETAAQGQERKPGPPQGQGQGQTPGRPQGPVRMSAEAEEAGEGEGEDEDDIDQQAEIIAEILYGLYGEDALQIAGGGPERLAVRAPGRWDPDPLVHPRGPDGRFIKKGSSDAATAAREAVGAVLKGGKGKLTVEQLAGHLALLTVKQLRELHREHGQKIPGRLRADLVEAVKGRLQASQETRKPKKSEPKKKRPEKPAGKKSGKDRKPVTPLTGHPFNGKSREEMAQTLAQLGHATAPPDPWGLAEGPEPAGAEQVRHAVLKALREAKAQSGFNRPHIPDLYDALHRETPSLSLHDFQKHLTRMYVAGEIRLDPYTQNVNSIPRPEAAMPLDREIKYFVDTGDDTRKGSAHRLSIQDAPAGKGDIDPRVRIRPDGWPEMFDPDTMQWVAGDEIDLPEDGEDAPPEAVRMSVQHAPAGYTKDNPLRIGGQEFTGGEFIPDDVLAQATAEEKAQLAGKSDAQEKRRQRGRERRAKKRAEKEEAQRRKLQSAPRVANRDATAQPTQELLDRFFPGQQLSVDDAPSMVGAPAGAEVHVYAGTYGGEAISIGIYHPYVQQCSRMLHLDRDGKLVMHNMMFFLKKAHRGSGLGLQVFSEEVRKCAELGVDRIETCAGKGGIMNGYYTWARLGYDSPLEERFQKRLPENLKGASTVQDLMATPEGREYWKAKGYMTGMKFDLAPGSRSLQVLNAYLVSKNKQPVAVSPEQMEKVQKARRARAARDVEEQEKSRRQYEVALNALNVEWKAVAEGDGLDSGRFLERASTREREMLAYQTNHPADIFGATDPASIRESAYRNAHLDLLMDRHRMRMESDEPAYVQTRKHYERLAKQEGIDRDRLLELVLHTPSRSQDGVYALGAAYRRCIKELREE